MSDDSGNPPFDRTNSPLNGALPPYVPPQPGAPPSAPPAAGAVPSQAPPPFGQQHVEPPVKKKRWPWIVAGLFVFCALPLGGCVALIGLGVNAIGDVRDDIDREVAGMFDAAVADEFGAAGAVADESGGCFGAADLEGTLQAIDPTDYTVDSIAFVRRSGNSYLANNADSESFVVDGRTDESAAQVRGTVSTASGEQSYIIELVGPGNDWAVCSLTVL